MARKSELGNCESSGIERRICIITSYAPRILETSGRLSIRLRICSGVAFLISSTVIALATSKRPDFVRLLARAFAAPQGSVRRTFRRHIGPRAWSGFVRDRGLASDARPAELDVFDWVAMTELIERRDRRRGPDD